MTTLHTACRLEHCVIDNSTVGSDKNKQMRVLLGSHKRIIQHKYTHPDPLKALTAALRSWQPTELHSTQPKCPHASTRPSPDLRSCSEAPHTAHTSSDPHSRNAVTCPVNSTCPQSSAESSRSGPGSECTPIPTDSQSLRHTDVPGKRYAVSRRILLE